MKVLHLVHSFQTGGAERVVANLVHFAASWVDNTVCSLTEPNDLAATLDARRSRFFCLKKRAGNDFGVVRRLARLIDEQQIDIVHAQGWGTYLEGLVAAKVLSRRRPRFIFAFHGKSIDDVAQGVPWRRRAAQRLAFAFTDACIAPAGHMARDYAGGIGVSADRVTVIYNGIDTTRFSARGNGEIRRSLGLDDAAFVIGFTGRLDPVKNIDTALAAFGSFRAQLPEAERAATRMLIVGDGAERASLEKAAQARGLTDSVIFAGMRSDVPACMSAMDVYLQPSFYEGHSLTLLEAMAMGLPVIATRVGGTPEIIADGENGYLREPRDSQGMAQVVRQLYSDPELRKRIGSAGRGRVTSQFSVATMVGAYEHLYMRLLNGVEPQCAE
jgi:sugar transferase (PEP-CTERM/EpsH1 system associated)